MVEEREISNSFRFADVFNDMALHKFIGMDGVEERFWDAKLPDYSDDAEFIRSIATYIKEYIKQTFLGGISKEKRVRI